MAIEYACAHCDSRIVTREAWAEWDVARQSWVLSDLMDQGFCHGCHRKTALVERPVVAKK